MPQRGYNVTKLRYLQLLTRLTGRIEPAAWLEAHKIVLASREAQVGCMAEVREERYEGWEVETKKTWKREGQGWH